LIGEAASAGLGDHGIPIRDELLLERAPRRRAGLTTVVHFERF
jgi:hypothetical protein